MHHHPSPWGLRSLLTVLALLLFAVVLTPTLVAQTPTPGHRLPGGWSHATSPSPAHGSGITMTASLANPPGFTFDCSRAPIKVVLYCYRMEEGVEVKVCETKILPHHPVTNPGGYSYTCTTTQYSITIGQIPAKCHPTATFCRVGTTTKVQDPQGSTHNPYPEWHTPSF